MSFGNFAGGLAKGLSNLVPIMAHDREMKQNKELGEKLFKIIGEKETATDVFQAVASNPQMSGLLNFNPAADPKSSWLKLMQGENKPEPGINPDYMQMAAGLSSANKPITQSPAGQSVMRYGQPMQRPVGLGAFWNQGGKL